MEAARSDQQPPITKDATCSDPPVQQAAPKKPRPLECCCSMSDPLPFITSLALLIPILAAVLAYFGFRGREVLLGIDLGTTYSSVAIRRPGGLLVAEDSHGRLGTPSVVAIGAGGEWCVGESAEAILALHPSRGVVDSKRVIGRQWDDPMVASESVRHGGRLVVHPWARRVAASGKGVRTAKQRAVCASGAGACWPDLAFALAIPPGLSASQAATLATHPCVDEGSLVEVFGAGGGGVVTGVGGRGGWRGVWDALSDRWWWGTSSGGGGGGGGNGSDLPALKARLKNISRSLAPAAPAAFILLTPQAAACLVVSNLMASAERTLGYPGKKAMGASPTDFNAAQRAGTLEAMERAGLSVVRLLHEPTAAAVAYGLHKSPSVHYVLVFDFGGGTLDVSVLFSNKGAFTVIGTAGDNALGGEDVDDCVAGILRAGGGEGCEPGALSQEAERVKKALSGSGSGSGSDGSGSGSGGGGETSVPWTCTLVGAGGGGGGRNASGVVTGEDFDAGCGELLKRSVGPVREALEGSNLKESEVDEVVLVGGSSRLPAVRAMLREVFGGRELRTSVDPDLAVALGAAVSGD